MKIPTIDETAARPDSDDGEKWADVYVRSYLMMRLAIGALGMALPVILIAVVDLFEGNNPATRGSMSAYYYTGARDIFVAVLCVVGVFLVGYKLQGRRKAGAVRRESNITTFAGIAAILVAFFPTNRPHDGIVLVPIQDFLSEDFVKYVHYASAATFILLLAYISFFFAHAEGPDSTRPKDQQARQRLTPQQWWTFHASMGAIIVVAVIGCLIFTLTPLPDRYALFITEWVAVCAFSASWLAKGAEWKVLKKVSAPNGG